MNAVSCRKRHLKLKRSFCPCVQKSRQKCVICTGLLGNPVKQCKSCISAVISAHKDRFILLCVITSFECEVGSTLPQKCRQLYSCVSGIVRSLSCLSAIFCLRARHSAVTVGCCSGDSSSSTALPSPFGISAGRPPCHCPHNWPHAPLLLWGLVCPWNLPTGWN